MTFFANVMLGRVRAYQGHPARRVPVGKRRLQPRPQWAESREDVAYAMLAEAALARGDGLAAKEACEASWRHTVPERTIFIRGLNPMAEALLACGELVAARRWADDTVAMVPGCHKVVALIARAHIALAQGESEQAERDAHDALAIAAHTHGFLRAARCRRVSGATGCRRWQRTSTRRACSGPRLRSAHRWAVVRFPVYQAGYDAAVESLRKHWARRL